MSNPYAFDYDNPRRRIDIDFGNRRRIAVGGRWPNARALVLARRAWRCVRADRSDRPKPGLGEHNSLRERHAYFRILDIKSAPLGKRNIFIWHLELVRDRHGEQFS